MAVPKRLLVYVPDHQVHDHVLTALCAGVHFADWHQTSSCVPCRHPVADDQLQPVAWLLSHATHGSGLEFPLGPCLAWIYSRTASTIDSFLCELQRHQDHIAPWAPRALKCDNHGSPSATLTKTRSFLERSHWHLCCQEPCLFSCGRYCANLIPASSTSHQTYVLQSFRVG